MIFCPLISAAKHVANVWCPLYRFSDGCQNNDCEGKLHWLKRPYDSTVSYPSLTLELDLSKERCTVLKRDKKLVKKKCHESARSICQFDCDDIYGKSGLI